MAFINGKNIQLKIVTMTNLIASTVLYRWWFDPCFNLISSQVFHQMLVTHGEWSYSELSLFKASEIQPHRYSSQFLLGLHMGRLTGVYCISVHWRSTAVIILAYA